MTVLAETTEQHIAALKERCSWLLGEACRSGRKLRAVRAIISDEPIHNDCNCSHCKMVRELIKVLDE